MDRRDFCKGLGAFAALFGFHGHRLSAADEPPKKAKGTAAEGEGDVKITFMGTGPGMPTKKRFNSSTLLQYGGRNYLIDCGEPAASLLNMNGCCPADLTAVFITHPHLDHYGGLYVLTSHMGFYRNQNEKRREKYKNWTYQILVPGEDMAENMRNIWRAYGMKNPDQTPYKLNAYSQGVIYDDGVIKVSAFGNDHLGRRADGTQRSNSLLVECANGRRIYFSGDLAKTCDLPLEPFDKPVDLLVCELIHYPLSAAVERLKGKPIKKICFQHCYYETPEAKAGFEKFAAKLTAPAEIVEDRAVRRV